MAGESGSVTGAICSVNSVPESSAGLAVVGKAGIGICICWAALRVTSGPPKAAKALASVAAVAPARKKPRKKAPPQYCPVPGCKNKAAPIFGMVCSAHKDVPKAKIKEYREARRAKKDGGK